MLLINKYQCYSPSLFIYNTQYKQLFGIESSFFSIFKRIFRFITYMFLFLLLILKFNIHLMIIFIFVICIFFFLMYYTFINVFIFFVLTLLKKAYNIY